MKKTVKEWRVTTILLLVILVAGFLLRFINLTILPVFVDEAIYVRWAQVMAWEPTLRFLPLSDGKQPLYMWVLMFLIKFISDPLFTGRLVSVICGLGTIVGIFTLSYLLFKNKTVSLFSSFLYCLSPFAVFFDRMALVDSMLAMFGVWTAVFGFLTVKYKRLDFAILTGFFLGFASLTKSPFIFFALLLPGFWILSDWPKKWRDRVVQFIILSALFIPTYILTFAMYNIQRLGPNFELLSSRTADYVLPITHVWTNPLDPFIPYIKDFFVWIWTMGPWALFPMMILGSYFGLKKYTRETLVLLAWAFIPLLAQAELARVFTARYIFFTLPYLFILSGLMLSKKTKLLKMIYILIVVIFVFSASRFNFFLLNNPQKANLPRGERSGYLEEWTAGQGIAEIADYLKAEHTKNPNQQIVVGTEGYFGTLPDGLQIYVNDIPNIVVIGVGVIIEDTPQSLKEAVQAGNKTYLVINKSRFKGDANKQGLELISSYPKALRLTDSKQYKTMGPQEVLLFYQLTP